MKKKIELLLPAGSFESAYQAIEGGADAIYLGLNLFSARKSAKNLSFYELKKILKIANQKNFKIYITINTLILDSQIENLLFFLFYLSFLNIDAIIFQDLSLIEILKYFNFSFPLHASTQTACNNSYGTLYLKNQGIERIILPRELTKNNIKLLIEKFNKNLKNILKDNLNEDLKNNLNNKVKNNLKTNFDNNEFKKSLEFETFIHGALCYSFSGLCLASGVLTNRSANRGECSQICRNDFLIDEILLDKVNNFYIYSNSLNSDYNNPISSNNFNNNINNNIDTNSTKNKKYSIKFFPFSSIDLFYDRKIEDLINIGIDSFKIEGRMKSPEYSFYLAKYYKELIKLAYIEKNNSTNEKQLCNLNNINDNEKIETLKRNVYLTFLRNYGTPYLQEKSGKGLISNQFPYHKGFYLGNIKKIYKDRFLIYTKYPISVNDGILIFYNSNEKDYLIFSIEKIFSENGKEIKFTNGNENIFIYSQKLKNFHLSSNCKVYHLSSRFLDLKKVTPSSFKETENIKIELFININNSNNDKSNFNFINFEIDIKIKTKYYKDLYFKFFYREKLIKEQINKEDKLNTAKNIKKEKDINKNEINKDENSFEKLKEKIDKIFYQKHKSIFEPDKIEINININENLIEQISLAIIKKIRRIFYKDLTKKFINYFKEEIIKNKLNEYKSIINDKNYNKFEIINGLDTQNYIIFNTSLITLKDYIFNKEFIDFIKKRENLNPQENFFENKLPFIHLNFQDDKSKNNYCEIIYKKLSKIEIKDKIFVFAPLLPVIFDDELNYFNYIFESIKFILKNNQEERNDKKNRIKDTIFVLGISNIGQIIPLQNFLNSIKEKKDIFEKIFFFVDFYLYITNIFSISFLNNLNNRLYQKIIFAYPYIENKFINNLKYNYIDDKNIPLFFSRGCFVKNNFFKSCSQNCKKEYKFKIKNNNKEFNVYIKNCITYLFLN